MVVEMVKRIKERSMRACGFWDVLSKGSCKIMFQYVSICFREDGRRVDPPLQQEQVNGDDPVAVTSAFELAAEWRQTWQTDATCINPVKLWVWSMILHESRGGWRSFRNLDQTWIKVRAVHGNVMEHPTETPTTLWQCRGYHGCSYLALHCESVSHSCFCCSLFLKELGGRWWQNEMQTSLSIV